MKDSKLIEIQEKLDKNFAEYTKQEFNLHFENYKQIKPHLDERDELVKNVENFWGIALSKSDFGFHEKTIDYKKIVKFVKVLYEENYWCRVEIALFENDFTSTNKLCKRFNVLTEEIEVFDFDYKQKCGDILINFMKGEEVDLDIFDTIYDVYINAINFYYS